MPRKNLFINVLSLASAVFLLGSCKYYKQDLMLRVEDREKYIRLAEEADDRFIKEYEVQPYDNIDFTLYLNNGEALIDPTGLLELKNKDQRRGGGGVGGNMMGMAGAIFSDNGYQLDGKGYARLPLAGKRKLSGFTKLELDSVIKEIYSEFYTEDLFVESTVLKKYIYILGSGGGGGGRGMGRGGLRITMLPRENMSVLEVLAMSSFIPQYAKMDEVRLLRGTPGKPVVYELDFTTVEGVAKTNMNVKPYDILYIEPGRRIWIDSFRDVNMLVTTTASLLTTILVLSTITNR